MISALNRYPKQERRKVAQEWARRSNAVQSVARIASGVDADTLRSRALHDARGAVIREGHTYRSTGTTHWQIRRSLRGRTDQRDIVFDGALFRTCGPRRMPAWLR